MPLRVLEIAEMEAVEAAGRYNAQSPRLGHDFLAKPEQYPRLETLQTERDIRRCILKRFPYTSFTKSFLLK